MSFNQLSQSGQPKNVYTHPRQVAELILRQLGVFIGFISFQHNFQGLVDLLHLLKLLRTMEDEDIRMGYGMLINKRTKKTIKTKLDRETLSKLEQVWERGGYLLTRYAIHGNTKYIAEEYYLYEMPSWEIDGDMEELTIIPALFTMKSKDEVSSQTFLMRINGIVPEREAYRNQDPRSLCQNGKLEYEENGILKPFFKTHDDIIHSPHFTQTVPRNYYDIYTTIAWRESLVWLNRLHINVWKIALELEGLDEKTVQKPIASTTRIEGAS